MDEIVREVFGIILVHVLINMGYKNTFLNDFLCFIGVDGHLGNLLLYQGVAFPDEILKRLGLFQLLVFNLGEYPIEHLQRN